MFEIPDWLALTAVCGLFLFAGSSVTFFWCGYLEHRRYIKTLEHDQEVYELSMVDEPTDVMLDAPEPPSPPQRPADDVDGEEWKGKNYKPPREDRDEE